MFCLKPPLVSIRSMCMLTAGLVLAASSHALTVEFEPNNTLATAQVVPNTLALVEIAGSRSFNDPSDDFFAVQVRQGGLLSIRATSPDGAADSIMGLFGPLGSLVASNDDSPGNGFMSGIDFLVDDAATGWYVVGLSGFNPGLISCTAGVPACYDSDGDFVFDTFVAGGGAGGSTGWDYRLTVSGPGLVPEPGTVTLVALAIGLMAAATRPRNADKKR